MSIVYAPGAGNIVCIESEHGDRIAGDSIKWIEKTDFGTPSGSYMTPTGRTMDRTQASKLVFKFKTLIAGNYTVMARAHTFAGHCAWVWLNIDGDKRHFGPRNIGRVIYCGADFTWGDGRATGHSSTKSTIDLAVGTHTLTFTSLGGHMKIDRVAIVPTGSTILQHGDTGAGPAESTGDAGTVDVENDSFLDWLYDPTKNRSRIILVKTNHATGSIRLGSKPFLDQNNIAWDGWLTSSPYLLDDLTGSSAVGDIEFTVPIPDENPSNFEFNGHTTEILMGDISWKTSAFRVIATATNEECRPLGRKRFSLDLLSSAQRFDRTFHSGDDIQKDLTLEASLSWILGHMPTSVVPTYINLDESELDTQMRFTVTESTNMYALMKQIVASVDGYLRTSQNGELEIFKKDDAFDPNIYLTADSIVDGRIQVIETIPPVNRVVVVYNDDAEDEVFSDTGASTGDYKTTKTIVSTLKNTVDAQSLSDKKAIQYAKTQRVREIEVAEVSVLIQQGNWIGINHPEFTGAGMVQQVERVLTASGTTIEVIT